jgi:AcrR family transcriptional regulator
MKTKVTLETLKSREKEARRDIIIDAAERVFATKPYDKASMREIAVESGMSTSSIYRFFPNQEALLVAAAVRATKYFNNIMEKVIKENEPKRAFEIMVDSFIEFISQNDAFFSMMTILMSQGNLNPASGKAIASVMNRSLDLMDTLFHNMGFTNNTRMLSRHLYTSLMGIIVSYNKLPRTNREDVVQLMKRLARMSYQFILNCPEDNLDVLLRQ